MAWPTEHRIQPGSKPSTLQVNIRKMRLSLIIFSLILPCVACRQPAPEVETKTVVLIDTVDEEEPHLDFEQAVARKYIERQYDKVQILDTSFVIDGLDYDFICRHFCNKEERLTVPAKYNFDTKQDFKTYNFVTDLMLVSKKDTILRKRVEKIDFKIDSDTVLMNYATLLFPNISLKGDTISVNYSISIPGTDIGRPFSFQIAKDGHYKVNGL